MRHEYYHSCCISLLSHNNVCIAQQFSEKLRNLNSVIRALEQKEMVETAIMARALVERSQIHLQEKEFTQALADANMASRIKGPWQGRAWRCVADIYRLQDQKELALQAMQQWAKCDAHLTDKIQREIQKLALSP